MMSCILSRQLSSNQHTSETHCVLREFSADLLAQLLRFYQFFRESLFNFLFRHYRLPHIHTRVIRALSRAFTDQNISLPTLYGATFAICELGADVCLNIFLFFLFLNLGYPKNFAAKFGDYLRNYSKSTF